MQTRIDPAKRTALYAFSSLAELGDFVKNTPRTWRCETSREAHATQGWDLKAGYDASVSMARNGWNEGAERVQDALKAFAPATPQPDTKIDFYGFRPHVPRFCAGAPDNMIRHAPVASMGCGRVLTLAVAIDANADVSAEHMANFGVAIAQYVNQLEMQDTRVEVIGVTVGKFSGSGWRVAHSFTVKHADQPLDLAVLAFAIGHPAMLRRIGFALTERSAAPTETSYGGAVNAVPSDVINAPPGMVILNGMAQADTHARTPAKALEYVSAQIDKAMEAQYQ